MRNVIVSVFLLLPFIGSSQLKKLQTQVLVVGGGTGGVAAGIQSARTGAQTVIVEQTGWLGGMLTAAGVSCTDGNAALHSGIWEEFRQALYKHYGTRNLETGWVSETCFEPHVGDSIFKAWAARETNLKVYYGWYFDRALKTGNKVTGAAFVNSRGEHMEVEAMFTIDATELGDVFASAGAAYDLGTEDSSQSGEKIAPGRSAMIQDLTWTATLKNFGKGADKTIPVPPGYEATRYYCSTSDAPCNGSPYAMNTLKVLDYGKLSVPKGSPYKYMLNWPAHGNDCYLNVVELKPIEREQEYRKAKDQTLGFIHFLQTKLKQKNIGLAEDEMDGGMAFIPYNREGRRVRGKVRFNVDHMRAPYDYKLYRTGIAVGDYPVDHHHGQYPGRPPSIPFPKVPAFNIPLGALLPERISNLVVCEKGISVSNIANGSTRLQPVVLLTGQAAGLLAATKVLRGEDPITGVRHLQEQLLKIRCWLMPFADVPVTDPAWEMVQRIGVTGIIEGVGKAEGWANKMYFYPDSLLRVSDFLRAGTRTGLLRLADHFVGADHRYVTLADLTLLYKAQDFRPTEMRHKAGRLRTAEHDLEKYHLPKKAAADPLTRKEAAIYLDYFFDLFEESELSINGSYQRSSKAGG
ncbi:MAG: FAD-dependent oxidoreductase [Chitinophagaceae bacterium]|nr:FAD-dependent oxidoreductase [Chitinophagaceae bacterium]